jgi:PIN domain nuclease of toxin-antitoxin system
MRILLDTHIFMWWLGDEPMLSKKARALILEAEIVFVSSISIWEAVIKTQLGKLEASIQTLIDSVESEGFSSLMFTMSHAAVISSLPTHHRDPFDRALVAQAIHEPAHLITADQTLSHYSELVLLV